MGDGVAGDDQPAAAAGCVVPIFLICPAGIVAQIDIIEPFLRAGIGGGPLKDRALDGEFFLRSWPVS